MTTRTLLCAALLVAVTSSTQGQLVDDGRRLAWSISVRGGDSTNAPRTYRLYSLGEEFHLLLTVTNEFDTPLFVDQRRLQQSLGLTFTSDTGARADIRPAWLSFVRFSGERFRERVAVEVDERVQIDAERAATWTIGITRIDGGSFESGTYKMEVALSTGLSAFRDSRGDQWAGPPVLPQTDLALVMARPGSTYERRREAYILGRLANEEGEFEAAAKAYEAALGIEPSDDTARSFLASAYVTLRRYRDAAPLLQELLGKARGENRMRAAQTLAFAHVAMGDEPGAIRILQAEGFTGQKLASELSDLRARVGNRP